MTGSAWDVTCHNVDETLALGRRLGQILLGGEIVALIGPLGAGKTQLVKGIAWGAGASDESVVTSPTFVLVNEYRGALHLYHLDAYRLNGSQELIQLGFDEMMNETSVVVVEWADRVLDVLPEDRLTVTIDVVGDRSRRFQFSSGGPSSARIVDGLSHSFVTPH